MSEVWVASLAGAVVAGGASIYASNKASGATQDASNAAVGENRREFDLVRGDTAGQRFIGNAALDRLARLYGYGPVPTASYGPGGSEVYAGATPVNGLPMPKESGFFNNSGAALNPYTVTGKLPGAAKIFDPAGALFGNLFGHTHGDEKRNLKAFAAESGVMQLADGRFALPNGAIFTQDQLQKVAGTWYGAVHAPDGDQAGWQQKYNTLISGLGGDTSAQGSGGTGSAYRPTPGGGVQPILQATQGADGSYSVPGTGTPSATPAGPDMSAFFESPDYQFRLSEGQKAIDRSAAARSGLLSGRAVKEGERYNSGLASGEYGAFVDRLMQQAGLGTTGIGASAAAGANATNNITQAITNNGNSRASSYINGAAGVNNAVQGGLQSYLLSRYLQPSSSSSPFIDPFIPTQHMVGG